MSVTVQVSIKQHGSGSGRRWRVSATFKGIANRTLHSLVQQTLCKELPEPLLARSDVIRTFTKSAQHSLDLWGFAVTRLPVREYLALVYPEPPEPPELVANPILPRIGGPRYRETRESVLDAFEEVIREQDRR